MEHLGKLMKVPIVGQAMGQLFPLLGVVAVIKQTMPSEGREAASYCRRVIKGLLNPFCYFAINEFEGSLPNDLYRDIHLHLESRKAYNKAKRVTLFRQPNTSSVTMRLADSNDVVVDVYKGMTVWWTHYESRDRPIVYRGPYGGGGGSTERKFQLKIRKRDKARLLPEYLDYIAKNSSTYSGKMRDIKIFTNSDCVHSYNTNGSRRMWEEIPYKHPSTFDTLAIDPGLKETIIADLNSFANDRLFYQNTGRAWKRGYLLFGPPGTGKSSMIAAMANLLKYDIYDLELSQVITNGELRQLLVQTSNRSIIVLEDIDCSVNFTHSRTGARIRTPPGEVPNPEDDPNRVTLSGLLNFVDGLWSCCGDERIFVFTTNHVEKLDKALLRPGRMDMQIELSYCTFPAFKVLAQNYLSTQDHPLFPQLESAFQGKTMTPAQIAELLIKDKRNVDVALENVISALKNNVPESPGTDKTTVTPDDKDDKDDNKNNDSNNSINSVPNSVAEAPSKLVIDRSNLIATLQGVIKLLENSTESQNSKDPELVQIKQITSSKSLPGSQKMEPEFSNASMKDLAQSIRDTLLKNKGDIDTAIEGVIHVLENKLPISSKIQEITSCGDELLNGSTANGHSSSASGCTELANGSSPRAASN